MMTNTTLDITAKARWAGALYLIIIVAGLGAELGLRAQLVNPADAGATGSAILANPVLFRLSIAADLVMAICDAGLAILLYAIFRQVSPGLALSAMVFRLVQTALIAASLMAIETAWLLLSGNATIPIEQRNSLALTFVLLHGFGYDLGLIFFGINSLMMGMLVWRSQWFARAFGFGLAAAGLVYLAGSSIRLFFPDYSAAFAPAYAITILAETAFCIRLLLQRSEASARSISLKK